MISVNSKNNLLIRLPDERIRHITKNHPEMKNCISWILETIENPDLILAGDFGELLATRLLKKTPVTNDKYLVVIYKETSKLDGFILTAYFSRTINKTRKIVWKP
jgi:hypothetical protein